MSNPVSAQIDKARDWLRANPVSKLGLACVWLLVLVLIADQASKAWILYGLGLSLGQSVPVLPFFSLTLVHNEGVSFGLLGSGGAMRWILVAFQLVVGVVLSIMVVRLRTRWLALAIALIAGGAIGNVIDRIRFGYVIDFLDASKLHFPWVFNVADAAINIGVVMLLWHYLRTDAPKAKNQAQETGQNTDINTP